MPKKGAKINGSTNQCLLKTCSCATTGNYIYDHIDNQDGNSAGSCFRFEKEKPKGFAVAFVVCLF